MALSDNLQPASVWKHFENLCSIPHPSKHEEQASRYVQSFARDKGLAMRVDELGNVLVCKPATLGHESSPTVVIQSHLDMVPQKNSDTIHDFTKDPIVPYVDGEWVKARGTTLGADNGIGVAIMAALLEDTVAVHGPIEALFTVDEETGMAGANGLNAEWLKGRILINLDTEREGELFVGCAGGIDCVASFDAKFVSVPDGAHAYTLSVKGLKGGHSGIDINLGRGNAIKLIGRLLYECNKRFSAQVASISGGSARNAIPREAFAVIVVKEEHVEGFRAYVEQFQSSIRNELRGAENELFCLLEKASPVANVLEAGIQKRCIQAIVGCPNGVIRMSDQIPELVETSNNLAIVRVKDDAIQLHCMLRSSIDTARDSVALSIESVFDLAGAQMHYSNPYPGWAPKPDSQILVHMSNVYRVLYGVEPETKAVHAGLECGIIGAKYPGMDMISCGPDIRFPHSPDECVSIASVERFWNYLLEVLARM